MYCQSFPPPRLSLLLLVVLLLLLVGCRPSCGYTTITHDEQTSTDTIDEFFQPGDISDALKSEGDEKTKAEKFDVKHVESVFIVAADGVMVALAEVNNSGKTTGNEFKIDLLAKYIETKEDSNWGDEVVKSVSSNGKWKTQLATENKKKTSKDQCVVKSSAVTVKGNKIYYIAVSNSTFEDSESPEPSATEKWHAQLVVGELNNNGGKTIKWTKRTNDGLFNDNTLKEKLIVKPKDIPSSDGVVFVMKDQKILFFMKSKAPQKDSGGNEENVTAIFQLEGDGDESKLELLLVERHEKCYPSLFQWEGNVIMTPKFCPGAAEKQMKKFDVTGKKFTASNMSIAHLQVFLEDKTNFVTAVVEGKKVLLFMQEKYENGKGDIHLWITDGTRARDVGSIINNIGDTFYGSVIHTNDELFALHQNYKKEDGQKDADKFSLTRLKGQQKNITFTLQAWNKSDKIIPTLCSTIGEQTTPCANQLPTDGLVGFLHNRIEKNEEWIDEYFYVNATVKSGKKINNGGIKFDGKGAGAKWPVGRPKEDQPYNFTDFGFTLVANVTIDTADKDNAVLGVGYNKENNGKEEKKNIGLRCTAKNEWELTDSDGAPKPTVTNGEKCQQGSTYLVALLLSQNKLSVYIDGAQLDENKIQIEQSANITHFYFGADDESNDALESHVTVTNALLYNRPLPREVIKQLKIIKNEKPKQGSDTKIQDGSDDVNTREKKERTRGDSDNKKGKSDQSNDTADDDNTNSNNNGEGASSSTPGDSTVRGGVVGVLLFLLLLLLTACM